MAQLSFATASSPGAAIIEIEWQESHTTASVAGDVATTSAHRGVAVPYTYTSRLFVGKAARAAFAIISFDASPSAVLPAADCEPKTVQLIWTTTGEGASCTLYMGNKVVLESTGSHRVSLPAGSFTADRAMLLKQGGVATFSLQCLSVGVTSVKQLTVFGGC
jgi:hypothetical protein